MKLSIVVPVYNEKGTIREILRRIQEVDTGLEKEIIVVNDASSDGTREILETIDDPSIRIFHHDKNGGKGRALQTGFSMAQGDIILIQDADLEYDPQEYSTLLAPILDNRADAVYGSRFLGGPHRVLFFWHYAGNRLLTTLSNMLSNINLTDMETCYKVITRPFLDRIKMKSRRFGCEPELTMKLARLNARIYEVPISYSGRDYSEGKKIGWKDGLAALFHLFRFKFFD